MLWLYGVRAGPIDHFSMRCEPDAAALSRMSNELLQYPDARAIADDVRMQGELE